MSISDHISESLETIIFWFKNTSIFDADPDPGSGIFLTLNRGSRMEKFGSEIRDKYSRSATGTLPATKIMQFFSISYDITKK